MKHETPREAPADQYEVLALTPEQDEAFKALKQAFTTCNRVGLYLWDNYGSICAVNGRWISGVSTDGSCGEPLDQTNAESFTPRCWHGSNADDPLFVARK